MWQTNWEISSGLVGKVSEDPVLRRGPFMAHGTRQLGGNYPYVFSKTLLCRAAYMTSALTT